MRILEISTDLEYVLEVIEGKYSSALIDNKKRQKVHFHIYFRTKPNFSPGFTYRNILTDKKFILKIYILSFFLNFIIHFLLEL